MVFTSVSLQAQRAPEATFEYGEMPTLVARAKQPKKAPKVKKEKKQLQDLDQAIEQVDQIAQQTKDEDVKKQLQNAAGAARDAGAAVKKKKEVAKLEAKGVEAIDGALQLWAKGRSCSDSSSTSSSSSSSGSCDVEAALKALKKALNACCCAVREEIESLSEALLCSQRIVIDELPVIIEESGAYCVAEDLSLDDGTDPAITVLADNVDIDLGGHVITVTPDIAAIFAEGITNLTVHHGTLRNEEPALATDVNSHGALLLGDSHVTFEDVIFFNLRRGIEAHDSSDLTVENCKFDQAADVGNRNIEILGVLSEHITVEGCDFGHNTFRGVLAPGCNDISVRNSKFSSVRIIGAIGVFTPNISTEFAFDAPVHDVVVADCQFTTFTGVVFGSQATTTIGVSGAEVQNCVFSNMASSAVSIQSGVGILVQDCVATAGEDNQFNLIQMVFANPDTHVNDIEVINCSFSQETTVQPGFDTALMTGAQGVLFDTCIFDASPEPLDNPVYIPANFHIDQGSGQETLDFPVTKNVRLVNSIVRNAATIGVFVDLGNVVDGGFSPAIEIDNSQIDGAVLDGIRFVNVMSGSVKNSLVTNTTDGNGISLLQGSQFVTLLNNAVLANVGDGIFLSPDSSFNVVKNNTVSNNGERGINNSDCDTTNEFYNNSACNNGDENCFGIEPATLMVAPAGAYVNGANICCTPFGSCP